MMFILLYLQFFSTILLLDYNSEIEDFCDCLTLLVLGCMSSRSNKPNQFTDAIVSRLLGP